MREKNDFRISVADSTNFLIAVKKCQLRKKVGLMGSVRI